MQVMTRSAILVLSALLVALLFTAACRPIQAPAASAPPAEIQATPETNTLDAKMTTRVEKYIRDAMQKTLAPGMAVCIVKDGQIAYTKGFGVATVGTDKPVTPESMFQMMDAGRPLVAAAVMQLVEQGKVDLDAPVTTYLPYFQMKDERYKQITVHNLLTSSSGLPTADPISTTDWVDKTPQTDDGALERTVRGLADFELDFDPGTRFSYSYYDYDLLGDLIAKVSGQTFEAYMQEHILAPLGMTHSTFLPQQADPEALVSPHMNEGQDLFVSDLKTGGREHGPSLGLWSSANDVCRWALANINRGELDGRRILDAASFDLMWSPDVVTPWPNEPPWDRFGMGWFVTTEEEHQRLTYDGGNVGFLAELRMVPDRKFGLAILTNLASPDEEGGMWGMGSNLPESLLYILTH